MCTVTWWRGPSSYELFFNRDELKTRKTASPPEERCRNGVPYIAPLDGDFSGTWIFANAFGLTAALLNHYPEEVETLHPEAARFRSRGLFLLELADCLDLEDLGRRLENKPLYDYRPFHLLALTLDRPARRWTWEGKKLIAGEAAESLQPVTTSSFALEEVGRERKRFFEEQRGTGEALDPTFLERYHHSHKPGRGAHSVCMMREDAETVSFSRVCVNAKRRAVTFAYAPKIKGIPEFEPPVRVSLPLMGREAFGRKGVA